MASDRIIIRSRVKVLEAVDPQLFEFASNASPEELNSALMAGLRLWYRERQGISDGHRFQLTSVDSGSDVIKPASSKSSSKVGDLGFAKLDMADLGLGDLVLHTAQGG